MFENNRAVLEKVVEERRVIRNVSKHRNPDGTMDIEGNLKIWENAMASFEKIKLYDKAPDFNENDKIKSEPFIVFVPAKSENRKNATIIVAHGGGFEIRTGCEGVHTAKYFNDKGFDTAILSYRIKPYSRMDSLADMQRAIRLLRAKKEELNISDKIFVMGFSAGGMISANCATHFDMGDKESSDVVERKSSRPDAVVVCYGAMTAVSFPAPFGTKLEGDFWGRTREEMYYLAPEKNITPNTPPFFIWQTMSDDGRHGMCLAKALQDAEVAYELHIFTDGVHGLAMADSNNDLDMSIPHVAHWGELCSEWLEKI